MNGIPIRVHRGKAHIPDMLEEFRYRYDGLYRIAKYWQEEGQDGFKIWLFRMEKLPYPEHDLQLESRVHLEPPDLENPEGNETPTRQQSTINRIVRSTAAGNWVKRLHDFRCQICGIRLTTPAGAYAETCHIKPLGRPHNGPDVPENILCLCPNCHVLLDEYSLWIADDYKLVGRDGLLRVDPKHALSSEFLQYHRGMCGR